MFSYQSQGNFNGKLFGNILDIKSDNVAGIYIKKWGIRLEKTS